MRLTRPLPVLLAVLLCGAVAARADLARAKAEPNLEKRSKLALDNAFDALKQAQQAYEKGDMMATQADVEQVRASVELMRDSLKQTGKDPRRSPKYFKRAEIESRELLRKLDAFEHQLSYTDRPLLEKTKIFVQQVHDDLLMGLMEGKRK